MEFCALASGSSGNCFFVGNGKSGILVDAGISTKQILKRMSAKHINPKSVKALFITHEHSDHIRGADVFARKFNVPIFATKETAKSAFICSDENLLNIIGRKEKIKVSGLNVEAFPKSHKAAEPVSFSIFGDKIVSVITDAGYACNEITKNVSESDFLCIESNHDEEMLENGPYPYFLKKWIRSDIGHLSNRQAGLCVLEHASGRLKNIMLAHLSKTNNTPKIALKTFKGLIKERKNFNPKVHVSLREKPSQKIKF